MKSYFTLLLLMILTSSFGQLRVGDKVPNYVFSEVLNGDKQPYTISNQGKPLILEFWTTWCSACIPAMEKLESIQSKYENKLEILTISTDKKSNLTRFINNTQTKLKIAIDTLHVTLFDYKYIPHTILIDKDGFIKAITSPNQLTDEIISDFIAGKELPKEVVIEKKTPIKLSKEFKNNDYQYTLTSENSTASSKNGIKRDENNVPISLEYNNVSMYRLLVEIYELSSVARIYPAPQENNILNDKYCFKLEQTKDYKVNLLDNAKVILNEKSGFKAQFIEKTLDSVYVLEVLDKTKIPKKSIQGKTSHEYRGPYFKGTHITAKVLVDYIEDQAFEAVNDKTGIDFNFDIELDWNYENYKSLNVALKEYGLIVRRSKIPEKVQMLEVK